MTTEQQIQEAGDERDKAYDAYKNAVVRAGNAPDSVTISAANLARLRLLDARIACCEVTLLGLAELLSEIAEKLEGKTDDQG